MGGGFGNTANGTSATVSGGYQNIASGNYSAVPGGAVNEAIGAYSFAAGRHAKADNTGSFAWADSNAADFHVSNNDRFGVRASGGVYLYTNSGLTAGSYLAAGSGTWNYKSEDRSIRHMGPMAQDLHAAFGLGDSDKSIATIDADGVALAAIQGLKMVKEKDAQIAALKAEKDAEITDLKARLAALEGAMERLAQK